MGLERLLLTLRNQGVILSEEESCDVYLVPMGEAAAEKAFALTSALRQEGISAQTDVMGRSLRAQMKYADKINAKFTIVIGDNEIADGLADVKNMKTGEKTRIALTDTFAENFSTLLLDSLFAGDGMDELF
jgi:histidyl-tRNA synthetase